MTLPQKADLATYGGRLRNLAEVADPETDLDADAFNECRIDVAAMGLTASRSLVSFVGHATAPTDPPSGHVHASLWGDDAPVKPIVAKDGGAGTGRYTLTFPVTIVDELGTTRALNMQRARGWAEGAVAYHVQCEATAANVVLTRVFDMTGAATDAVGVTITVEAY